MLTDRQSWVCVTLSALLMVTCGPASKPVVTHAANQELRIDFRYHPQAWDTLIALPDDSQKAIINDQGTLLLDFPGPHLGFGTTVAVGVDAISLERTAQMLAGPKVPIVITDRGGDGVSLHQEAFAIVNREPSPRQVALTSDFSSTHAYRPVLTIDSKLDASFDPQSGWVRLANKPFLITRPIADRFEKTATGLRLVFSENGKHIDMLAIQGARDATPVVGDLAAERSRAVEFWLTSQLPWDRIHVPDPGIQSLLESSVRNIYQAREIINGVPEYRTGPTVYRGIWVVDGAFMFEVATWLGDVANVRKAIDHIMAHQQADGQVVVMNRQFLKETGIMLWAIYRHALLTQDKAWLRSQWSKIERAVGWISNTVNATAQDPASIYAGLMPPGYSDGGIDGVKAEYTNTYWNMSGLKAAIDAARWLGQAGETNAWAAHYQTLQASFQKASARDKRTTATGSSYLPILMEFDPATDAPQKAQWAFCQAVYPGEIFAHDDPVMKGTLAMLDSFNSEGLVANTGWLKDGLWTYFGSFYAHAHLWQGDIEKAQETLYAFGNHASPLLAWREEQMPQGKGSEVVGDMPHNWASAEFIRLVRHLIAFESGGDIHLLQGVPDGWLIPGANVSLRHIASEFGTLDVSLDISRDGQTAVFKLAPLGTPGDPGAPIIHLQGLKRLGFKDERKRPLPDIVRGTWAKPVTLKLTRSTTTE